MSEGILDPQLAKVISEIKEYVGKDYDFFMVIEGYPRFGKSAIASQIVEDYNPEYDPENVVYSRKEFIRQTLNTDRGGVVWVDEGSAVFTAKEGMKKESIWTSKLLDVMGYKNHFVIICVPDASKLFREIREGRINVLIRVYKRGKFVIFDKRNAIKAILQKKNGLKRGESRAQYAFRGDFRKPSGPLWDKYVKIKAKRIESYEDFEKEINKDEKSEKLETEYLNPSKARKLSGLSQETLAALYDGGIIEGYTLDSGQRRYLKSSILQFIEEKKGNTA